VSPDADATPAIPRKMSASPLPIAPDTLSESLSDEQNRTFRGSVQVDGGLRNSELVRLRARIRFGRARCCWIVSNVPPSPSIQAAVDTDADATPAIPRKMSASPLPLFLCAFHVSRILYMVRGSRYRDGGYRRLVGRGFDAAAVDPMSDLFVSNVPPSPSIQAAVDTDADATPPR
jgi:hypothetical protein